MEDLKQALRTILVVQFKIDGNSIDNDTRIFSNGLIDSLSVIDLVCFVERKIGHSVPPSDITLDNFDSISRITAYAETLTSSGTNK